MMAREVSRRAPPMAPDDVLHRCTPWNDVGHGAWTSVVAHVSSMPTRLMALHCFLHLAHQLWTLGLWALDVARVGAMRMMALLMAKPNWPEHLTFLLKLCPWLWAGFVTSHVQAARLVARLDFLHFVLHCLVKGEADTFDVEMLMILVFVLPHVIQLVITDFVIHMGKSGFMLPGEVIMEHLE